MVGRDRQGVIGRQTEGDWQRQTEGDWQRQRVTGRDRQRVIGRDRVLTGPDGSDPWIVWTRTEALDSSCGALPATCFSIHAATRGAAWYS